MAKVEGDGREGDRPVEEPVEPEIEQTPGTEDVPERVLASGQPEPTVGVAIRRSGDDRVLETLEPQSFTRSWSEIAEAIVAKLEARASAVVVGRFWVGALVGLGVAFVLTAALKGLGVALTAPMALVVALLTVPATGAAFVRRSRLFTTEPIRRVEAAFRTSELAFDIKKKKLDEIAADMKAQGGSGEEIEWLVGPRRTEAYDELARRLDTIQTEVAREIVASSVVEVHRKKLAAKATFYDVFVAYHRSDREYALALVNAIRTIDGKRDVFIDGESLRAGDDWMEIIPRALERSKSVVFILTAGIEQSDASTGSPYFKNEVIQAIKQNRDGKTKIIPIMIEECELPYGLGAFVPVRCAEHGSWAQVAEAVVATIGPDRQ